MKAAAVDRFGPPSLLTVHDLPVVSLHRDTRRGHRVRV